MNDAGTGAATAARRLTAVLRAENAALAAADPAAASALLQEKLAAAAALTAEGARPSEAEARDLRDALAENGERLALAIEVQGRIMELVGRAARQASPSPPCYGRGGRAVMAREAVAVAVRA